MNGTTPVMNPVTTVTMMMLRITKNFSDPTRAVSFLELYRKSYYPIYPNNKSENLRKAIIRCNFVRCFSLEFSLVRPNSNKIERNN